MLRGWGVLVLGLLLPALACARSGGEGDEVQPTAGPVSVEVTNRYPLAMQVYAIGSGITHRIGTVHPGMAGRFTLPQNLIGQGSVRFEARPSGDGQPFRSGEILLAPGSVVDFVIAAQLFNSTVTRRP